MRGARRLAVLAFAVGLLGAGLSGCEWPDGTRFVDEVFADVDVTTGVVYRHTTTHDGEPIDLELDVYQPRGDARAERPVVFWMFGGGWTRGDRNQLADYAQDSARRGYVGVTIDYRIRPDGLGDDVLGAAVDAYDDAVAAAQWLEGHAADYRIDPDAIIAGGYSAGAVNALNLLFMPGFRGPATSPVAGAVAISGVSLAPPTAGDPPAIMHHGTADDTVPYDSARATCDQTLAVGNVCEFVTYEGGDHFIVSSERDDIQASSAHLVFERVLWPLGYRVDQAAA
jgi:acetyl esterase/lipase